MRILLALVALALMSHPVAAQVPGNPIALNMGNRPLDAYVVAVLERQAQRPCALDERVESGPPPTSLPLKFDPRGRLVSAGAGGEAWKLQPAYDPGGRVTSEQLSRGKLALTYSYQYDKSGRAIAQIAKDGARQVSESRFTYQGGRLTSFVEKLACCGDYRTVMTYDQSGRLETQSAEGDPPMTARLTYDAKGRLASVTRGPSEYSVIASSSLQYGDDGRVSELESSGTAYTVRYACPAGK